MSCKLLEKNVSHCWIRNKTGFAERSCIMYSDLLDFELYLIIATIGSIESKIRKLSRTAVWKNTEKVHVFLAWRHINYTRLSVSVIPVTP